MNEPNVAVKPDRSLLQAVKDVDDLRTGKVQGRVLSTLSVMPSDHADWLFLEDQIRKGNLFSDKSASIPSKSKRKLEADINGDGRLQWWERVIFYMSSFVSTVALILQFIF